MQRSQNISDLDTINIYVYTICINFICICTLGWPIFKSRIKTGGDKKIWGKNEFPCA